MRFHNSFVLLSAMLAGANGSIAPPLGSESAAQCSGLTLNFDRLQNVVASDFDSISRSIRGRTYDVSTIMPVTGKDDVCQKRRHRLQETFNGVHVFGANVIVTVDDCDPDNTASSFGGYTQTALDGVPLDKISAIGGKSFANIEEATGTYVPSISEAQTIGNLATHFGTTVDKVGALETTIFPSKEKGDLLAYRSEVWVSADDDIQLYDVFVSATSGEVFSICNKIDKARRSRLRNLRERDLGSFEQASATSEMCGSCAAQDIVTWTTDEVECPINSLYLDNTNKSTTCLKGTLGSGEEVLGPGIVSSLHYYGSYDCNSREEGCNANELPTECSDALSDVHYGITRTLEWFQESLGVMGGLGVDGGAPIKTASFVHFGSAYCNAFFTTQTNSLYFGDCDCAFWTPLTSIDVAAHELAHGVTNYASGLVYAYQSGGLNEGYSDIVGATMEYVINDSKDTPDFNLGENLIGGGALEGFILRYMEDPAKDGKSIANVCDFNNDMNVHYTSGVPNFAFVSAVQACEAAACSADLRECVLLMGPLFMYANIHGLTQLSGYMDAAQATCSLTQEFMDRGQSTSCTAADASGFVKAGWGAVGVTLAEDCAPTTTSGCAMPDIPAGGVGGAIDCFRAVGGALRSAVGWFLGPFFGGDDR